MPYQSLNMVLRRTTAIAITSPTKKTMMENVVIVSASLPEDALSAQVYRERDPERDERGDEDDGERCHRIHS
jgi:hypothetical protein